MNEEDFRKKMEFLFEPNNNVGLMVNFVLQKKGKFEIKPADLEAPTLSELLKKMIEQIRIQWVENSEFSLLRISKYDKRRDALYYYDIKDFPLNLSFFYTHDSQEEKKCFNFSKDSLDDLYGFIYVIGTADKKISFFRKFYPINLMKRDRILMIYKVRERFVEVKEDIIKIETKFDFIKIDNDIFIANVNTLERFFEFEDIIRNQADLKMALIEQLGYLEDIKPLQELIKELKYAKKVMKVDSDSPVLKLKFADIHHFINHHPILKKQFQFNSSNKRIILETKKSKENFIKLLNDDYLKSELTKLYYESDSKNTVDE